MDGLPWTWFEISQALAIFPSAAPSQHTATVNPPENTAPGYRKAFFFGPLNHHEDLCFLLCFQPLVFYLSHEPPFVFFLKIANSTA